jgi:hypothetical protein
VNHLSSASHSQAKDKSEDRQGATAFGSKNITFSDVETNDGSKVPASVFFPTIPRVGSKCGGPIQRPVAMFI